MIPGVAAGDPKVWAAAASAVVGLNLSASVSFAAEITGNGTLKDVNGRSFCAHSGQEDLQWYTDDTDTTLPARRGTCPRRPPEPRSGLTDILPWLVVGASTGWFAV